ncbi:MAG: NAD(P)-dependent oxidoreductase [Candidatus Dojkabacteria bacterium]|nr:NAD(P)-dependent oxidoreductase [Candidatus Dojkabacteria bacterium]
MKRILLTGGSDFIGSHILRSLVKEGYFVRVFDVKENSANKNIKNYEYFEGDITSDISINHALENIDIVLHLAAIVSSSSSKTYFRINSEGTNKLARASEAHNIERFVFISSMSAAGPSKDNKNNETSECKPANYYGQSKLKAEEYLKETSNLDYVILRPSAVYGPGAYDTIPLFKLMDANIDINFLGHSPKFKMVYIDDFVRAVITAIKSDNVSKKTYFIAHPEIIDDVKISKVLKLAFEKRFMFPIFVPKFLIKFLGCMGNLSSKTLKINPFINSDKVKDLLGDWVYSSKSFINDTDFQYKIGYKVGMKRTVRWYKEDR